MLMGLIDNILGPLNLINRLLGGLQLTTRRGSRRYRGRVAASASVRCSHPRHDKRPEFVKWPDLVAHMLRYGIVLHGHTHDATAFHFSVTRRQYEFYLWLYGDGKSLRSPRRAWSGNPP